MKYTFLQGGPRGPPYFYRREDGKTHFKLQFRKRQYKVCSMQALHDGCDIVGGSIDERGGWLLRPGYRDMMQQIKGGKVDRVYICRMRQISGKERHLYSFFKRLMQHGVQVTATEYSLRDRVNMFRLARRVERYATRKGLRLPW